VEVLTNTIDQFEANGTHQEIGVAMGRRIAGALHAFFENYDALQEELLPFYSTPAGRDYYEAFLRLHRTRFPDYMAELEGMAQGAERPFEEIFLVNLRGEFKGLLQLESQAGGTTGRGHAGCTDCLVFTPDVALIGHNEDGSPAALDNMFAVRVNAGNNSVFTALCYPGFLPGNAFGVNQTGVLHTVNHVSPRQVRVGLGRHFIARSLLDAPTLDDAVKRATVPGQAAGFNYNIGSLSERRMVSIEVSPDGHHVHKVRGHYLHTNHYLNLMDVDQEITLSSRARLARGRALCRAAPPTGTADVLALLGDRTDRDTPIYCEARPPERNVTLCSALFDLDSRELRIYSGHPVTEPDTCMRFAL
jgi:hypothetical protein